MFREFFTNRSVFLWCSNIYVMSDVIELIMMSQRIIETRFTQILFEIDVFLQTQRKFIDLFVLLTFAAPFDDGAAKQANVPLVPW